jgi:hypothetical protein
VMGVIRATDSEHPMRQGHARFTWQSRTPHRGLLSLDVSCHRNAPSSVRAVCRKGQRE